MFWQILVLLSGTVAIAAEKGNAITDKIVSDAQCEPPYHVQGDLVSVVIPAYHEENYIRPTLDAIIHQTYSPIEIVIADQTQDQEGIDAIDSIASEYGCKIIHISEKNVALGRNIGAEESTGEIVLFLDADAIMAQDFTEKLVNGLNIPGKKLAHGLDTFYNGNAVRQGLRILSNHKAVTFTTGKGVAMRKIDFMDVGEYNENLDPMKPRQHEDIDLGERVAAKWGVDSICLDRTAFVAEACRRPVVLRMPTSTWTERGWRDGKAIEGLPECFT